MVKDTNYNKPIRLGPVALTTATTTNIWNPPSLTGGTPANTSNTYLLINRIRVTNKTTSPAQVGLWLGSSGANAAGTEAIFGGTASVGALTAGVSVPAQSYVDWSGELRMDVADFLVGGASVAGALTIAADGEIGSNTAVTSVAPQIWDTGDKTSTITLSGASLVTTKDATSGLATTTAKYGKISGKWRFQVTVTTLAAGEVDVGVVGYKFDRAQFLGATANSIEYVSDGRVIWNNTTPYTGATYTAGDVIDVFVDATNLKAWFAKNGVIQNGDPVAGTGGTTMTGAVRALFPAVNQYAASSVLTANFAGPYINSYAADATYLPWDGAVVATKSDFRMAAMYVRDVGWFAHAMAEFGMSAAAAGVNVLTGATATADLVNDGAAANALDGNTTTFWGGHVGPTQSQAPTWWYADAGASTHLAASYLRIRGRDGGGGGELQAPTLFDLYLSQDGVSFDKSATGLVFTAFAATTPGELKELTLP